MRKLIFILLVPLFVFGQRPMSTAIPFISGNDTIPNINVQDTVLWQGTVSGLNWPATWHTFTDYITVAEKVAEDTQVYILADETYWTWFQMIRFRIDGGATVLTSNPVTVGATDGKITLFVQPDTIGTDTIYKVRVGGN